MLADGRWGPWDELVQHQQHAMGSHSNLNTHICWLMALLQLWQFTIPADASMYPQVPDSCCVHRRMEQPLRDMEGRRRCAHLCMARAIRYGVRVSII